LFEQMAAEGYRQDLTGTLLQTATHKGKIDPYPSVPPYEGPTHEMEQQAPDV